MYKNFFKPSLDFTVALIVFLVLSPIFLITCILLIIVNNGKPFFIQTRPGLKEKPFVIIKFKSMNDRKDANGNFLPDAQRLTKVGKWVRKLSLDEIPQLINVLKGDMSIVGPRPLLMEYLPLYNEEQKKRHEVKPGITGWAQVNGRNAISWDEKFKLDVWYVDYQSFKLDVKIIFKTAVKILKSEGINSTTSATMEKFKGETKNL